VGLGVAAPHPFPHVDGHFVECASPGDGADDAGFGLLVTDGLTPGPSPLCGEGCSVAGGDAGRQGQDLMAAVLADSRLLFYGVKGAAERAAAHDVLQFFLRLGHDGSFGTE
jgi:hypothetical protein